MTLRAVKTPSLGDQVFERIGADILEGRYAHGEVLPPERELAVTFGVNRHVVREALKRLEQIRLVRIARGGRTSVLDFRSAGLDLLEILVEHARTGEDVRGLWLAVQQMRAAISPDVARLCALRADGPTRAALVAIAGEMLPTEGRCEEELMALEMRFWQRALEGADNLAYRLAFNSFARALAAVAPAAAHRVAQELAEHGGREAIAKAIASGDAERAESLTREAMRSTTLRLERDGRAREAQEEEPAGVAS